MRRVLRQTGTLMVLSLVALVTSACIVPAGTSNATSSEAAASAAEDAAREANERALATYVEAERAGLPKVMEAMPGLYSDIEVNGKFSEQDGTRGVPAGTYAVVQFDYMYAPAMDWSKTMAALDATRSTIDELCESTLFPAMREAGITGPMSVVYTYDDGRSDFGVMWQHACSVW